MTTIVVTAAVIEREGRFLVTKRQDGAYLGGCWEFPGGKCHPGEGLARCMARELREELDVDVEVGDELLSTTHDYPDRRVELHFLRCALLSEPFPRLGQDMRWVAGRDLASLEFPPADRELIRMLTAES